MNAAFVIDFIAFLILAAALVILWRERNRFFSLRPLIPAMVLIGFGHMADMLVEHPSIRSLKIGNLTPEQFDMIFVIAGNITDAIGAAFLIIGFVSIVRYQQKEMTRFSEVESMLPICSNCKKFRTEDNRWIPIERYLMEAGAPNMTHGICPECKEKLYGDVLPKKK